ncbi:MAG: T9SS type A sorting domain-containing protein [Bacteroidota bacterium]
MRKLLLFVVLLIAGSNLSYGQTYSEVLGRPTDSAITVSILFDQAVSLYVEYGIVSGVYPSVTPTITNVANTPDEIDITNLSPNTKYYYRTRYKATGSGTYSASVEHSFHTQRAAGSSFTFTVEADEHLYDKKGVRNMYKISLANEAKDNPDFMIDMGDIFGDDHTPTTTTSADMNALHLDYRQYLGAICPSVPLYLCIGNHEGEKDYYLHQTPPNNIAVYGTLWRKFYYPNPEPNNFYSGNPDVESYGIGHPENYYAWTWGNALFVVMDVYRYDSDTAVKPEGWTWTLGFPQYTWLKNTLENSTAKYKFVFAHHTRGEGRGGVATAKYFEWGGYEQNGTNYTFATNRPGWAKPIHQLFHDNGVNIFFQGHDHLFAHEVLDSVTYQEVPMPSDSTYQIGMLANASAYVSDTIGGTGHLRVTVNQACVKVDFVRAYLPADTLSGVHHNGEVAFSYTIGDCASLGVNNLVEKTILKVYPNPAKDRINIDFNKLNGKQNPIVYVYDMQGQLLIQQQIIQGRTMLDISKLVKGMYLVKVTNDDNTSVSKFVKQ